MTAALEHAVDPDLDEPAPQGRRPFVSIVVPAYNEALILMQSLTVLYDYLVALSDEYEWEIVVVNDGSQDETGDIANAFAKTRPEVRVLHHAVNFRLGQALRYAFNTCRGDYVVTIDCDLSYAPEHIGRLLQSLRDDHAKIAVASPYMKGGHTTGIPLSRRVLSRGANRFLSAASGGHLSTLTGMVRAYDRPFLSSLSLRAMGTDINTEIIYKARMLHARIVEVPAHLDWSFASTGGARRRVDGRLPGATVSSLFTAFLFRPFLCFVLPGLVLLAVAAGCLGYALVEDATTSTWVVGSGAAVAAVVLVALGVLAAQAKRYFEELYHLGTTVLRRSPRRVPTADEIAGE